MGLLAPLRWYEALPKHVIIGAALIGFAVIGGSIMLISLVQYRQ
jgi:hypothetical protein